MPGEVDATAEMNRLLEKKPKVTYQRLESKWIPLPDPRFPGGYWAQVPVSYQGAAKVRNSFVIEVQAITFDKAKVATLPEIVLFTRKTLLNCGDANVSSVVSLSLSGQRSWSVAKTDGVSTTTSASINGSVGVPGTASAGMTLSWSQTISCSTTKTEGFQESVSRTMSDTVSIGPKKAVNVSLIAYQVTIEIPFHATVVVEGDLEQNGSGLQKASALLSKDERTFPINGLLRITDVSDSTVRTDDLHGTMGCDGNDGKLFSLGDIPQSTFEANGISDHLKSGFTSPAEAARTGIALKPVLQKFGVLAAGISFDDAPTIGPPDGTNYEILYTTEIAKPAVACGFNDLGVPNTGIFSVETREYRTYVKGVLTAQWQDSVETFKSCWLP